MSEKYKFHDTQGMYFVTMATVGWVDLFTRWELKHVIIDSLAPLPKGEGLGDSCVVPHAQSPSHDCQHAARAIAKHHARFQKVHFQRIDQNDRTDKRKQERLDVGIVQRSGRPFEEGERI